MKTLALKLDIDTYRGYREGVPRLLDLFERRGLRASIFFSFGPDNSGKAIRRIFRPGFITKMIRTRAPSSYGIKTLLYGTLLPAPMIVASDPDIFRRAHAEGHDCGVHAWDHVLVQDCLSGMTEGDFLVLFERAAGQFEQLSGERPASYAAPGWQVSEASLSALASLGLAYHSSTRGRSPYYPVLSGKRFQPLEIPTTLPTLDEIWGADGVTDETLPEFWARGLTNEWNVLTIHSEMEGLSKLPVLERFLDLAEDAGAKFVTLREIANEAAPEPCAVEQGFLPGRSGAVAVQGAS